MKILPNDFNINGLICRLHLGHQRLNTLKEPFGLGIQKREDQLILLQRLSGSLHTRHHQAPHLSILHLYLLLILQAILLYHSSRYSLARLLTYCHLLLLPRPLAHLPHLLHQLPVVVLDSSRRGQLLVSENGNDSDTPSMPGDPPRNQWSDQFSQYQCGAVHLNGLVLLPLGGLRCLRASGS